MTIEQEKIIFQNSKNQISLTLINKIIEFIENLGNSNEITKLFGLPNLSPIVINNKTRGWSKGGKAKAEQNKKQLEERQAEWQILHQDMKKRNPGISDNGIDLKIAKKTGLHRSTVYNARKKPA